MRSIKLLVAAAAIAALVAGPVLAQDATGGAAPAATSTDTMKPAPKHHAKKHAGKKHHGKKAAAPATDATPAQ